MKVAVLYGGRSYERAVSIRSGERVGEALRELGHDVLMLDADASTTKTLREEKPEVVFVALHGGEGENGSIQELLETLGLSYTGSHPLAARTANSKTRAKELFRQAGIPTPEWAGLSASALESFGAADALDRAVKTLGLPLVAKPTSGGSALGVRFVADEKDLPRAVLSALSYDRHMLLERYVAGRELAVSILGTGDAAQALPIVEIKPRHAEYYDFESRYTPGETEFACPPDELTQGQLTSIQGLALNAYRTLGLQGMGRVDIILDADGTPWVLEANVVPGMTETSLLPLAAAQNGIEFPQLVQTLIDDAME